MRTIIKSLFCLALVGATSCSSITRQVNVNNETQVKLDSIVLPQVDFRAANAMDIIDFLTHVGYDFDPSTSGRKGVLIILDVPMPGKLVPVTLKDQRDITLHDVLNTLCKHWDLNLAVKHGAVVLSRQRS